MAKRGADHQITKDDEETGEDSGMGGGDGSTWQQADEKTLAGRTFVKAKRKVEPTKTSSTGAALNWGGTAAPAAAAATTTDSKTDEKAAETAAAPAKVAPPPEKKTKNTASTATATAAATSSDEKKDDTKSDTATTTSTSTATAAAASNGFSDAFAKFRPKPGQWDCAHCYVRNEPGVNKCRSCEFDRNEPAKPAPDVIPQAGDKSDAEKAAAEKTAALFGGVRTLSGTAPETSAPSFGSFGASSSSTPSFSFGSGATFGFGTASGITFGSVTSDGSNGFTSGGALEAAAQLQPEVPTHAEQFKDKKAEASGEEGDELVFKIATKVYQFQPPSEGEGKSSGGAGKFVEAGSGELHINTSTSGGKLKARLVLRAAQTQRLVLNAPIFPEMTHSVEDKWVKFLSTNVEGAMTSYALKFKNKAEATDVDTHINSLISKLKAKK